MILLTVLFWNKQIILGMIQINDYLNQIIHQTQGSINNNNNTVIMIIHMILI